MRVDLIRYILPPQTMCLGVGSHLSLGKPSQDVLGLDLARDIILHEHNGRPAQVDDRESG